ncbi:cadmium-translocating P-type ATPase [Anabaena cylindrica FACHB-243]|uniref:Copper-exporting P-type ATPase n=1 Tax=Anabaena cylindrica (strain ATCC 27899 / PCC 7122) TaxID=272123 RepID=K9ZS17_ANACC|nr:MULTISPECIES: heavy metal translocating P-type ATPase [Anabaena]AFZ61160.1 heavy metal translocating P-type ATPase [Anabaena cylindrica PCC 7122]MBD2421636.1 cadmium-translocating P-type ATPase [Anabaena cylindrica FACHB-243]MBY5280465.1 cadmium-translocating P-type ATPase [Anabaena sp. CCAP 1446/1C]MBY5308196.1 cadmium-translocating P-type ATPase [Anabaena sp. CCAP 1446/1C]MCM2405463.1 cadmium-translocating P-type ATPase [Anabaena sp. CCAP 1446/1C]
MTQTPSLKTQFLQVDGMDCGSCAKTIEASLQQLGGVMEASVSFATAKVKVFYDTDILSEAEIINRITALGYTVKQNSEVKPHNRDHSCNGDHDHHHTHSYESEHEHFEVASTQKLQAKIGGMDCGSCAKTVEVGLQQIVGVLQVSVSFATEKMQVSYDPQQVDEEAIYNRVRSLGYTVELTQELSCNHDQHHHQDDSVPKQIQKRDSANWKFWVNNRRGQSVILAGIGLVLGLFAQYLALPIWIARAFYGIGIVIAGYPIARAGLFELRLRRADMNLLMTISVIGAVILGDWFEAALVLFLFSLGTTLQVFTFGRTRNAISALMDLTPPTATVKRGNKEVTVGVETVQVGEILTIRPGQRVALDGVVVSGTSAIDQSPITGESIPEDKEVGDTVFAGTLNQSGFLEVKVTHTVSDTTVAKIIHLVEAAQESRAPSQQWVDRFAEVYTPIVILIAIAITLIPPLAFAQPFNVWFYRALVMLVIACPCALVISTPVSIVSAIGAATRHGVLFKGGNALEKAGHLTTLAFDKTGTITQGLPIVQKVYDFGKVSVNMVLQIAASLEQQSEHPLSKAIVAKAHEQKMELETPMNFMALPGKGIQASFGEMLYFVGNRRLFLEQDIPLSDEAESLLAEIEQLGQIPVLVGAKEGLLGAIALSDGIRLEATEAVRQLKLLGLKRLVMLSGDRTRVAGQIAQQVGITEYRAELLPEDKLQEIQQMRRDGVVGMVGDGINDAPALAAADISFAVGGIDIALETADVVIVGSDLRRLAYAIELSRRTVSVIQQNVIFSLVTKGLFLLLGTFGFVGLAVAVLADTGTSLLVTANGMRLFKSKTFDN